MSIGAMATTVLFLALGLLAWYFFELPHNYKKATRSGLPVYLCPVSPISPAWLVLVSLMGYSTLEKLLPRFIFDRVKLTIPGWEFHCKHTVHDRFGDVFILVSPGCNTVFVGDPEIAHDVLNRRRDFGKIEVAARILPALLALFLF